MGSPASFKNHPIHPMLIVFPFGLWTFSFICDLIRIFLSNASANWGVVAFYCIGGGIVGAALAAIPGVIDYLSLTDPVVKKIATKHMILNVLALLLFALNFYLRLDFSNPSLLPVLLSAVTLILISISGWLGGSLVYEHGVAVSKKL